jgi:hypothetical protein
MKTVHLSKNPPKEIQSLLNKAREDDVVVQTADGAEFILFAIDDFDEEIAKTRRNKKLMALLDSRAKQTKTIPLDQVKKKLGLA